MDIFMVLTYITTRNDEPNYQFGGSVTANTREAWEAVVWEDPREKPGWEDLVAAWPDADVSMYAQKRIDEYPPISDQIDAIKKGFDALRDSGIELPAATTEWLDSIQAVKDKYPTPHNLPE